MLKIAADISTQEYLYAIVRAITFPEVAPSSQEDQSDAIDLNEPNEPIADDLSAPSDFHDSITPYQRPARNVKYDEPQEESHESRIANADDATVAYLDFDAVLDDPRPNLKDIDDGATLLYGSEAAISNEDEAAEERDSLPPQNALEASNQSNRKRKRSKENDASSESPVKKRARTKQKAIKGMKMPMKMKC